MGTLYASLNPPVKNMHELAGKLAGQLVHYNFFQARRPTSYRVKVRAPRWSLVASSIPWWPGWKIVRNGKRVDPIRVNGAFLAFAVPPGESDVRVVYSPWTWWVGLGLAAAGLVVLVGVRRRM